MIWVIAALISYFFWSLVNVGEKYLVAKKINNPYVYLVLLTWVGLFSLLLIPFVDFYVPESKYLFWLILAGCFYFFGGLPYVRALKLEDITRINIWWNLIPFFSFIIAWISINEHLSQKQFVAFIILFAGSVLASIKIKNRNILFSKVIGLMIVATLFYSGYAVILRYLGQFLPFMLIFIWVSIIMIICTLFLFLSKSFRQDFRSDLRQMKGGVANGVISVALLDKIGSLFNIWALSLGPVSLIFALEGSQTLFVFLLVAFLSYFFPKILKEDIDKYNLLIKFGALILIIIGVIMVNL